MVEMRGGRACSCNGLDMYMDCRSEMGDGEYRAGKKEIE